MLQWHCLKILGPKQPLAFVPLKGFSQISHSPPPKMLVCVSNKLVKSEQLFSTKVIEETDKQNLLIETHVVLSGDFWILLPAASKLILG